MTSVVTMSSFCVICESKHIKEKITDLVFNQTIYKLKKKITVSLRIYAPTPRARISSLVMAKSSVVFSFDGGASSAVNRQRSERLESARETFRGFLNVNSTMIGSAETEAERGLYFDVD